MNDARVDFEELDQFVDGSLDAAARARVEAVLESSPEARQWLERRLSLRARLEELPREVEPESDLWSALAERIRRDGESVPVNGPSRVAALPSSAAAADRSSVEPSVPESNLRWRLVALAATLLLTLGLGFWLGRQNGLPSGAAGGGAADSLIADQGVSSTRFAAGSPALAELSPPNAMSDVEQALIDVKRELRRSLEEYREVLPAETIRSLDANLETIDRSIREVRKAIEANPESPELRRALVSYHENEIGLLQRVTRAASRL